MYERVDYMLTEKDFVWKEHYENNINTNPLGEYYCIIDCGNYAKKYGIVPQYPSKDGVSISLKDKPEYYVLFEANGRKATKADKNKMFYEMYNFDDYVFENTSFVRVFTTLEDAKSRAFFQYKMIFGYVLSHIEANTELATQHHFCVK